MRLILTALFFFYFSSIAVASTVLIVKVDSVSYYLNASDISQKKKDFRQSFNFLRKTINYSEANNDLKAQAEAYSRLSILYQEVKKHTERAADPSLLKDLDFSQFTKVGAEESIAKMKRENIEQLKAQQKESKFSKLVSILSLALISILSLLSLSLYRNNLIRAQSNQLLKEKNKELLIAKEKADQASAARSEFLSTVSHELRTPLNAITGITHLLREENPLPSQVEYLNSLHFSGKYLLNYINEILEINRIESKNIEVEKIDFDLKKLIGDIQTSLREFANANSNELEVNIDPTIPDNLIGDPTKLSQIFMNLINNSLKFTRDGRVTVVAKLLHSENELTSIYFEVADNGIGIPEDKLESVFESFSQGSIEINRKYGGTGLGLTIVKRLIAILGGEVKLKSQVNLGTVLYFSLEFKKGSKKTPTSVVAPHNDDDFIKKKILLVEDNKINQMITKRMLEKKQIICEIVENGEDAVEIAKSNSYDLILMDVHLPGINGNIATQQIRVFDKTIPIVALTAISLLENREMLLSYGMDDVITKPFEPDNFFSVIAAYLQKNQANTSESVL